MPENRLASALDRGGGPQTQNEMHIILKILLQ